MELLGLPGAKVVSYHTIPWFQKRIRRLFYLTRRRLQFLLPAQHTGLCPEMFRLLFIPPLHPDPGQTGIDMHVLRIQLMRGGRSRQGSIVVALGEIDFGQSEPGGKCFGMRTDNSPQLAYRCRTLSESKVESGLIDLVL